MTHRFGIALVVCCAWIFAQGLVQVHEFDVEAHTGDQACEVCQVANSASGLPGAASPHSLSAPNTGQEMPTLAVTAPTAAAHVKPPVRGPPTTTPSV